eukprot:1160175-Pelagomonas_calceolata.AAC.3
MFVSRKHDALLIQSEVTLSIWGKMVMLEVDQTASYMHALFSSHPFVLGHNHLKVWLKACQEVSNP